MNKQNIKYANCWEDAYLLERFLKVDTNSKVMSIASAGDNSLSLLKSNPKRMICIDYNPVQLYITELKAMAVKHFNKTECLEFLGFDESEKRLNYYKDIKPYLSEKAKIFWQSNLLLIEKGIIFQGKFERYLRIFSQRLLPLVRSKKVVDKLLSPKSEIEQIEFYNKKWSSWEWRLLFKGFFNKTTMGKLGRDPEKFSEVEGEIEKVLWNRTQTHFKSQLAQDNYMLDYIMTGNYKQLPPYLAHFEECKTWLQNNDIEYFEGDLLKALDVYPDCNRFNLSNIFEYMNEDQFQNNVKGLMQNSDTDSLYCYWNLLVKRVMKTNTELEMVDTLNQQDRGFFYNQFYCFRRK